jgi:glycosyltransferase involved in cell wall biosynthesis
MNNWQVYIIIGLFIVVVIFLFFAITYKDLSPYSNLKTTPTEWISRSPETQHQSQEGYKIMKKSKAYICGLIRDGEPRIKEIISAVERLGSLFKEYEVIIVENDSVDNTRKHLLKWRKKKGNVTILGCGINEKKCNLNMEKTIGHNATKERIKKMATLRNLYLDYLEGMSLTEDDYVVMLDLDIIGTLYDDGVAHSFYVFEQYPSLEAIGVNGLIWRFGKLAYYDAFAFAEFDDPIVWNKFDDKDAHDKDILERIPFEYGDPIYPVVSCFAGCVIYRGSSVAEKLKQGKRYNYSKTGYACEHVFWNVNFNMAVNPSMILFLLEH